jgi:photosystem II stability/assembly factor-like uncharacterized protein
LAAAPSVASAVARSTQPAWHVLDASLPDGSLNAVACPSSQICEAVGKGAVRTTDGGTSWLGQTFPDAMAADAVACATVDDCVAAGLGPYPDAVGVVATTRDGGLSWQAGTMPNAMYVEGLSCPTSSTCVAVGYMGKAGAVLQSSDGGRTWSRDAIPTSPPLISVSCPSTLVCQVGISRSSAPGAVAGALRTTNGGVTWILEPFAAGIAPPSVAGMSCSSTSTCIAIVNEEPATGGPHAYVGAFRTNDGGSKWTATTMTTAVAAARNISCPSAAVCEVRLVARTGILVMRTTDGGSRWTSQSVDTNVELDTAYGLSCGSVEDCTIVGSVRSNAQLLDLRTENGGNTWQRQALASSYFAAVTCPSSTHCVAVGQSLHNRAVLVATSADGGAEWTTQSLSVYGQLNAVSCPNQSDCVAVGVRAHDGEWVGLAMATTDGGVSWTVETLPPRAGWVAAIQCGTPSDCVAIGNSPVPQANGQWPSNGVSLSTTDGGATWYLHSTASDLLGLTSLGCASTSYCQAIGPRQNGIESDLVATANSGGTWTPDAPTSSAAFGAVACPAAGTCFVGVYGSAGGRDYIARTTDNGATWVSQSLAGAAGPQSIDCLSVSTCVASDGTQLLETENEGATWSSTGAVPVGYHINGGLRCASVLSCTAIGTIGGISVIFRYA